MRKIIIGFFVGCGISLIITAGAQIIYTGIANSKKEPVKMELSIYPDTGKEATTKAEAKKADRKEVDTLKLSDEEPSIRVCDGMIQYYDGNNWIDLKTVKELEKAEQEDKARIEAVLLGEKDKIEDNKSENKKTDNKATTSAKQTVSTARSTTTTTVKPAQTPAAAKPATNTANSGSNAPSAPTGNQSSSGTSNAGNSQGVSNLTTQNNSPQTNPPQTNPSETPGDNKKEEEAGSGEKVDTPNEGDIIKDDTPNSDVPEDKGNGNDNLQDEGAGGGSQVGTDVSDGSAGEQGNSSEPHPEEKLEDPTPDSSEGPEDGE